MSSGDICYIFSEPLRKVHAPHTQANDNCPLVVGCICCTVVEESEFYAVQLRGFIQGPLKEELWYLWVSICSLLNMQSRLCWNWRGLCAQALRLSDGANITQHVHTHTHTCKCFCGSKLYCQDTQEPNCSFPLCCVSNLLIMVTKSS